MEYIIIEITPRKGGTFSIELTNNGEETPFRIRVFVHAHSENQAAGHVSDGPGQWAKKLLVLENRNGAPLSDWKAKDILFDAL